MLYPFLLCSKVNQLSIYTYPLFFGFPSHLGHPRAFSRVPCAIQDVFISYPFCKQYCVHVNPNLPTSVHPQMVWLEAALGHGVGLAHQLRGVGGLGPVTWSQKYLRNRKQKPRNRSDQGVKGQKNWGWGSSRDQGTRSWHSSRMRTWMSRGRSWRSLKVTGFSRREPSPRFFFVSP